MTDLTVVAEKARLIRADCEADADEVDRTPFTPKGVGTIFGNLLAMIAALADCVEELAETREPHDERRYALDEHGRLEVPLRKE